MSSPPRTVLDGLEGLWDGGRVRSAMRLPAGKFGSELAALLRRMETILGINARSRTDTYTAVCWRSADGKA